MPTSATERDCTLPLPWPYSFGCALTPRGGGFPGHAHDHDEICLVANQGTIIRHAGVERQVGPGTVFLFRRGELHGYRNAIDQEPHLWLVHFQPDERLYQSCPQLADADPEERVWQLAPEQLASYQALFTRLMVESLHPDAPGHREALASWLRLILVAAARWDHGAPEAITVAADSEISNLWEVINEHLESPGADFSAALSRRVPNYDSLRHRFKRLYGRAPRDFLATMRINRAKHLLLETDEGVGWIAQRLGYGRLAEFTRAFTRQVGRSPRAFRARP